MSQKAPYMFFCGATQFRYAVTLHYLPEPWKPDGQYSKTTTITAVGINIEVLIDFSLTVKAATLIFISGRGSAISSAKQGKAGSSYNLAKN